MNTIYSWDKGWNVGRDFQTEKTSIQKDVKLHIKLQFGSKFVKTLKNCCNYTNLCMNCNVQQRKLQRTNVCGTCLR
ncbi:Protein of unknown function [Gryllus bimaculatus]|nr:Protein of unknown function [Gryllus bimaculatus]